jgi:hypothetical protein
MNGVEVYSLSGKLIYRQRVSQSNEVSLPEAVAAAGTMVIVKVSTAQGDITTRLWR